MPLVWPPAATLTLIRQRRIEQPNFEWAANHDHANIWMRIALQILTTDNFFATPRQCQVKWQALRSGYDNINHIEANRTQGRNVRAPNRYDRLFHQEMSDEFWVHSSKYLIKIYS